MSYELVGISRNIASLKLLTTNHNQLTINN